MTIVNRVLDAEPCPSLDAYRDAGGGDALRIAHRSDPNDVVAVLERSGLRGRGGAGFPTATKWRSVLSFASGAATTSVVINGAEGEPSTFKDRAILRANPYRVLEGALVACAVVGAEELVVCLKDTFAREQQRVRDALDEMAAAGWTTGLRIRVVPGPPSYLFGEETGLLEVVDGRQPFPRVTPPWRRGIDDTGSPDGQPGDVELAMRTGGGAAPALVNNVETFANVTLVLCNGPAWFRQHGTPSSPGTIVCTVVGDVQRAGVGEFALGTPLRTVIEELGGGALADRRVIGVLPGASSAVITEDQLDTPLTYEDFAAIGSGLGAAGFRCIDDAADLFALTHSASRFLSVESCGQCMPCKQDGLAITDLLDQLVRLTAPSDVERRLADLLATVTDAARCNLATQQQVVVGSLLRLCASAPIAVRADSPVGSIPRTDTPIVPLLDLTDGIATFDAHHERKQPDWSYDDIDSGTFPAQRLQGQPPATLSAATAGDAEEP